MTTIIDNAIDTVLAQTAHAEFPTLEWEHWHHYSDAIAEKRGQTPNAPLPKVFRDCIDAMVKRCKGITRDNCFPDHSLYGGGLHRIEQGGFLERHLDASLHAVHGWKREYSVILYLNPQWEPSDAGRFGMTHSLDPLCTSQETEWIAPRFNRMTIFRTHEAARHQVEQYRGTHARKSLALFFFSLDEPQRPLRTTAQFDPRKESFNE